MPSGTHAPIKKYNYERSLFRWVMSRHPEPFEAHGISTKTLERAPLAREAFYTSNWPGAKVLVHCSHDNKYERTAFFDAIIERGLRDGTRFNVDHVTSDERSKLGITMDRASGKYYLHAYGSTRGRRSSTRRGSATSSEGDLDQHPIIRELGDLIHSEIEAAGDNPDVSYQKSRCEPGATRGSTVLTFSVTIQSRDDGGDDSGDDSGRRMAGSERAGAAAAAAAADAGGGNPTGMGTGTPQQPGRPAGNAPSLEARRRQQQHQHQQQQHQQQQQQQQPQPGSNNRESSTVAAAAAALASVAQGGKKLKARGRPMANSNSKSPGSTGAGGGGGGAVRDSGAGAEEPPKRRKSVSSITKIFPFPNNVGAPGMAKMEPVQQLAGYSTSNSGGGGGPRRMDTSYGPSSLGSSHSSTSTTASSSSSSSGGGGGGSVRVRTHHQSQPVMAFAGGANSGSKSFLPGMDGVIPQPLQHAFQAAGGASSSSPSSGSSSSCSSPLQYGAGATAAAGSVQRSQPPPAAWNIPYAVPQLIVRNADMDDFDSQEQHSSTATGTMNGGGGGGSMGHAAEVGGPEAGGGSNTAGSSTGGRLGGGGGGHLPPLSLGMSGGAGYPTLLDHRASSQSRPQPQDAVTSSLKPCTPYTTQQSLSRQASHGGSSGGGGGGGGSTQAGWGGAAAVRTTGAGLLAFPVTRAGGSADHLDKELDFLEVFF